MAPTTEPVSIRRKIAALVQEKGWSQTDFARIADINRHTARAILLGESDNALRNNTVAQIAHGLGLTVRELIELPLEILQQKVNPPGVSFGQANLRQYFQDPVWLNWLTANAQLWSDLNTAELERLSALARTQQWNQKPAEAVERVYRERKLMERVRALCQTEEFETLEKLVDLLAGSSLQTGK